MTPPTALSGTAKMRATNSLIKKGNIEIPKIIISTPENFSSTQSVDSRLRTHPSTLVTLKVTRIWETKPKKPLVNEIIFK
jgi:hypothetical protein